MFSHFNNEPIVRGIKLRLGLTLLILLGVAGMAHADAVTDWNVIALNNAAVSGKNPIQQARVFAMTQAAVHDALNAIDRRYQPYAMDQQTDPNSSPAAAVAAAAHDVLVHELPTRLLALDAAYATSLSLMADGSSKTDGIAIGQQAAATIIALRSADGSSAIVPYAPGFGLGVWQPTPPAFLPALQPGWGAVTPFTLSSGSQFRPDSPELLDLTSEQYTRDFNEVKALGSMNSTTRTAAQSQIAMFWYEPSPGGWNRIARIVSAQRGLDLWENARLFGLLNFAMSDGLVAGFDAKYTYNFWRPVTAIRAGDTDGNEITRSFTSFSQAAQENADSRVYAGLHFRTTCTDGLKLGRQVGRFGFKHYLKPAKNHDD